MSLQKVMQAQVVCNKCGVINIVTQFKLNTLACYDSNDQEIYIMFICCDNCKERMFVQVDDNNTNQLLRYIKNQIARAIALKGSPVKIDVQYPGEEIEQLSKMRRELDNSLNNTMVTNAYGISFEYKSILPQQVVDN